MNWHTFVSALTQSELDDLGHALTMATNDNHDGIKDITSLTLTEKLAAKDNFIEAIRLYRQRTGRSLKESKDAVDAYRKTESI